MFSFGTRMLVNRILPVAVPRMPHFGARASTTSKPGMSGVTRNAVTFALAVRRRRAGHHGEDVRDAAVGDVVLGAVQDVRGAVLGRRRGGLDVAGVGAGFGFGEREGAELRAVEEPRQPLRLLFLRAEEHERANADRVVRVDEHRDAGVVPAQDLHRLEVLLLAEAEPAELGAGW